jgi:Pentapeptide repeats (8 copies)
MLQGADLGLANLEGADLQGANLQGADLQEARNLTQEQLDAAEGDDRTQLPAGLTRPARWSKAEGNEGQPAAQPDGSGRAPAAGGAPGSDK